MQYAAVAGTTVHWHQGLPAQWFSLPLLLVLGHGLAALQLQERLTMLGRALLVEVIKSLFNERGILTVLLFVPRCYRTGLHNVP